MSTLGQELTSILASCGVDTGAPDDAVAKVAGVLAERGHTDVTVLHIAWSKVVLEADPARAAFVLRDRHQIEARLRSADIGTVRKVEVRVRTSTHA